MPNFEYKVVPAPKKGLKGKGIKGAEEKFANALATVMNELGADGWEYQRSDTLPSEERSGLRGKTTVFHNVLVFRRKIATKAETSTATRNPVTPRPVRKAPEQHAPLLDSALAKESRTAPAVGPATEATEVRDPRVGSDGQ
ncbi:DUF4177 domain-containing protein [Profundibacter amoris]|uniref:DUF4177 domain-containing protein n=1 Tax=Profundibacter amoris TaxID=2171755 RepID=A0A347UF25_9RHOB|nr:DUF4177 domain-containing protein [Profundibacter amoris]AXX97453.1 DUF4177 domain-containing protein [Profundibacter amoris]